MEKAAVERALREQSENLTSKQAPVETLDAGEDYEVTIRRCMKVQS